MGLILAWSGMINDAQLNSPRLGRINRLHNSFEFVFVNGDIQSPVRVRGVLNEAADLVQQAARQPGGRFRRKFFNRQFLFLGEELIYLREFALKRLAGGDGAVENDTVFTQVRVVGREA
jgi:hypothetical protein